MTNIYINKKQLATLNIGLMSLTRDEKFFDFAVKNGVLDQEDPYLYIETLKRMIEVIDHEDGALLVTEINMDDIQDCVDLWGNTVDGSDL